MTSPLDRLAEVLGRMTGPGWKYEPERFSAKCVIGINPLDDRWIAHFQPAFNGEANAQGIALLRNIADKLLDVVRAAGAVLRYDEGDGGSRLILEADLQRMHGALTALDAAILKELGNEQSIGGGEVSDDKITISKSSTADTRTCDWSKVTRDELLRASRQHIADIRKGFDFFIRLMNRQAEIHDLSKITHIDDFHRNFATGFKEQDWWEYHQKVERHHFKNETFIQNDVNLIDIIDQIVDGVMAGMARSGEYRKEPMSADLLLKAYDNTINLLLERIEVKP